MITYIDTFVKNAATPYLSHRLVKDEAGAKYYIEFKELKDTTTILVSEYMVYTERGRLRTDDISSQVYKVDVARNIYKKRVADGYKKVK